jgi:hypothetical protein
VQELLEIVLAFPTVIYTVSMALSLVYWLFVVIGAVDIDALGGSAGGAADGVFEGASKGVMEGAAKGVFEGAAKGVVEGATKGVFEGASKGALDAAADGATEGLDVGDGVLATLVSALRLRSAPVTVVLSLLAVFGWLASTVFIQNLGQPGVLGSIGVFFGSGLFALLVTSVVIRPLAPVFAMRSAQGKGEIVGKIGVVSTGEVTSSFGQATVEDGGAGLIVQIRCETGTLKRGDRVVLVHFDEAQRVYQVEKLPDSDELPRDAARPRISGGGGATDGSGDPTDDALAEVDPTRRRA